MSSVKDARGKLGAFVAIRTDIKQCMLGSRIRKRRLAKPYDFASEAMNKSHLSQPQMTPSPLDLSIVIPAFNEEHRLPRSLKSIRAYLESRSVRAEVLVVDDGSTDATAKLVESSRCDYPELRLICNNRNCGKGFSVRHGMLEARGEVALFTDADLSAPIEEADKLIAAVRDRGYDGAIGSRAVDRSLIEVHQSIFRELAGVIFNFMVRWITGIHFQDTQCGFKAFRRETARTIFEQQRIEGFGFDPEILFLAQQKGLRITEVPVRWAHDSATKVNVFGDSVRMLRDLLRIRWYALMGAYSSPARGNESFGRSVGKVLPKMRDKSGS
jgi:glycosyltransferase involved in cell wall biosynthesis